MTRGFLDMIPAARRMAQWVKLRDTMARDWHAVSDHYKDGSEFGAPLCNCERIAEQAISLGWVRSSASSGTDSTD